HHVSLRAIADHARASAFLIADGVFPDRGGREYVLRRIMRRAIYHGAWLLHIKEPFLQTLTAAVVEQMGGVYPELRERASLIAKITSEEEARFRETLDRGMSILVAETSKTSGEGGAIAGDLAFKLYDTYGFPLDLTRVIAEQQNLVLDEAGFETAMNEQRKRSEFHGSGEAAVEGVYKEIGQKVGATKFLGYEATTASSRVTALIAGGKTVTSAGPEAGPVALVVEATPFYGEQGGQIGDMGVIRGSGGAVLRVEDVKRPLSTLYVHVGRISDGRISVGDTVELEVDVERRNAIRRNHSATHLLHHALHQVLGDHVAQKGSLVTADRLRFDFSHFSPLTAEERQRVEDLVNARVRHNENAQTEVLAIADAKKSGAVAFFGEKYGDTVRVVTMGDSKEFCGGTHVARTGDIAFFKLTEETGVAQGVRRIEAVTGEGALRHVRRMETELMTAGEQLRAGPFEVAGRVEKLQNDLRERDREIEKLKRKLASGGGRDLMSEVRDVAGVRVLAARADGADAKALREVADQLKDKLRSGVIVLGAVEGDKVALVSMVTPDLVARFNAGKLVGAVAKHIGGKGGGRADMAQGGGTQPERLDEALALVPELVRG
ncbi:MAG TPA: alanine--tRNA ligase, partial [Polyangia bacterium]|nr:alanine--tRNA ligase [Polyangia bacterium]